MLSSYISMQNAILARNSATLGMMHSSNNMLHSISFGDSQPLRPSFSQSSISELAMKSNETKISVLEKLIEAYEKNLRKSIDRSAPKYSGVNYLA